METLTFRTPWHNRLGDLFTLAWQLPLFLFVAAFTWVMFVLMVDHLLLPMEGATETGFMWSGIIALFLVSLLFVRRLFWWRLVAGETEVQLGWRWLGGVTVPCASVSLLVDVSQVRAERERLGSRAIVITATGAELPFWIGEGDSSTCLEALRERCRGAAAVDCHGNDLVPLDPAALASGLQALGPIGPRGASPSCAGRS